MSKVTNPTTLALMLIHVRIIGLSDVWVSTLNSSSLPSNPKLETVDMSTRR